MEPRFLRLLSFVRKQKGLKKMETNNTKNIKTFVKLKVLKDSSLRDTGSHALLVGASTKAKVKAKTQASKGAPAPTKGTK